MANDIDLLFVGGPVITMDDERTRASAVAVSGERILAIGHADLLELAGAETEIVDPRGKALLPGFQDAHVHAVWGGVEMAECDLSGATDLGEYRRRIAAYATAHPAQP